MNQTISDLVLLMFVMFVLLMMMIIFGEFARSRLAPDGSSLVIETYLTRVCSWWVMVVLLGGALLIGWFVVVLLFAFCSYAAFREFLTLTTKAQADHNALVAVFYVVLSLQYLFIFMGWATLFGTFIPVYVFLLLPMISAFRGDANRFLIRVAETQWALMISVYCVSHIPALMVLDIPDYADRTILLIAFLVIVVQIADLVEYFFGRQFGKRRIVPGISSKTWKTCCQQAITAANGPIAQLD